jgi:hypothetical protein
MSLLVDSKCPPHQSAVPVPQLTTEPKDDPAHTQPLERIKQIAADIMGAALVSTFFDPRDDSKVVTWRARRLLKQTESDVLS